MLHFSDRALKTIERAMQARTPSPKGLRVGVMGSPCSGVRYIIRLEDTPSSDDQVIHCQGIPLFVDVDSLGKLQGVRVDFIEEADRRGFTFDNPNLSTGCSGCSKQPAAQ